jgi:hypothetical protein
METWLSVVGFPDYEVSSLGRIRRGEKILKACTHPHGYLKIALGRANQRLVHRVVAEAFCPNPNNYTEVDHIDRDKTNNSMSNLRWCTRSENNSNKGLGYSYCARDDLFVVNKLIKGIRHRKWFKEEKGAQDYLKKAMESS